VLTVEGVDGDSVVTQVGEATEVAPVGPRLRLEAVDEASAAHDEALAVEDALGHLRLAVADVDRSLTATRGHQRSAVDVNRAGAPSGRR